MNKANVRKWVKALRSGKYKQCRGRLFDGRGYCCLGIVEKLAGVKPYGFVLEQGAREWLGVDEHNPKIGGLEASFLNDRENLTFPQIADRIEKYWLGKKSTAKGRKR